MQRMYFVVPTPQFVVFQSTKYVPNLIPIRQLFPNQNEFLFYGLVFRSLPLVLNRQKWSGLAILSMNFMS